MPISLQSGSPAQQLTTLAQLENLWKGFYYEFGSEGTPWQSGVEQSCPFHPTLQEQFRDALLHSPLPLQSSGQPGQPGCSHMVPL